MRPELYLRAQCLERWADHMRRSGPPRPLLPSLAQMVATEHADSIARTLAKAAVLRATAQE